MADAKSLLYIDSEMFSSNSADFCAAKVCVCVYVCVCPLPRP